MNIAPDKGKIFSLSFAHIFNDFYMNYIPTLMPLLVASGLSVSKGAFLVTAFTVTSSVLQPVFGYLVDQKNQHWLVYVGTIWMAVLMGLVGLLENYSLLILVAALAGLGTAAFHPQASAIVSAVGGSRKGFWQSFFTAWGNVGWALTPLLVVPFVQAYHLRMTPVFILPGVLVAVLLRFSVPRVSSGARTAPPPLLSVLRSGWTELTKLVLVVACRSLVYFGLIAFLPLYLQEANISLLAGSRLLFVMLFCGAMGGVVGGYLSDRIGRKAVIVGSLILASPLFFFFLNTTGFYSYVLLALAGAALMASFSVTVVVAQNIISKNAALASGLMLGFGIGIGGIGVGLVGLLVEYSGIVFAINLLVCLPLMAGLFGLALKNQESPDAYNY